MAIALVLALSSALFVSMKGSRVLMTLYAVDLGAGPFETSLLFALYGLFPLLLSVSAGRIADRFDNRILMYCGLAGFAIALSVPFLFHSLTALFFSAALCGLTSMLFVVAAQNLVGVLATGESRTRYYSYYSQGESIASIIGPVFVGGGIDRLRHPATYLCLALFTLVLLALLHAMRGAIPASGERHAQAARGDRSGLLALPALRGALLSNSIVMMGLDLFNLYMPVYTRGLGFSATSIGLVVGAFGVAAFLTRLAIPPVTARWGERRMLAVALLLSASAFVSIPLVTTPLPLAAGAFVLGLGLGCGQPLSMILAFNAAPAGRSAEAIAMRLAVSYGAHVVIPPVFGALGTAVGLAPVFWTCAMLLSGGSYLNRAKRARPRSREARA
jgi:MFS family permease